MPGIYKFGSFELNARERTLLRDGVQVPLRLKAFETLRFLLENAGHLVTKKELLNEVWPDAAVEESNMNAAVYTVRKALGDEENGQCYIETVPRLGYRFRAQVQRKPQSVPALDASATPEPEKCVAVLYFENLSGEKEDEYFRDGMTEDVITELAKIKDLRILPRSAVHAFRDKSLPVTDIGQQLGTAFVLEGSIRRADRRIRITARLLGTGNGHAVWAQKYDRELEDVFAIQDEIAQSIAGALRVILSDAEKRAIEKVPTRDVQAYDYYLRGRQVIYQYRRKSMEYARQMFARAAVIDPSYAAAIGGVADCSSFLYMYFDATEDNLREAVTASQRAVQLDPESAEAHASRGLAVSLNKNYQEAQHEFDLAIQLNPDLFEAHYYRARAYVAEGNLAEAARAFEKAYAVNPDDYQAPSLAGTAYIGLGQESDALASFRRGLAAAEKRLAVQPDDVRALYLCAVNLYRLGDRARSLEWAAKALAIEPNEPALLYNIACVHALHGEPEQAITFLEQALANGYGQKEWIMHDPDLDSLRGLPRFEKLLKSLG